MNRWLKTGRSTMLVAAGWNLFDALLHVAVDMVEPPRIGGNLAVLVAAAVAYFVASPRVAAPAAALAGAVVAGLNLAWVVNEGGIAAPAVVFIAVTLVLLGWAVRRFLQEAPEANQATAPAWYARPLARGGIAVVAVVAVGVLTFAVALVQSVGRQLYDDRLVAADYWDEELVILSAGLGFDNIIGVPGEDLEAVREAGGAHYAEPDCVDPHGPLFSPSTPEQISPGVPGLARL